MKTVTNTSNRFAEGALQRLKIWFDPAMEGSPYENESSNRELFQPHKSVLLRKKVMLKF